MASAQRVKKRRPAKKVRTSLLRRIHMPVMAVLLLLALVVAQPSLLQQDQQKKPGNVLAYATGVSASGLLASTNQHRAANGAADLYANSLLNQAAQNKANDMATRDYWSHNTPEGNPPWVFITAVGYTYVAAGENLAYGFATSADVVTGWMNSPGHKANMLNTTFQEVGFGYANSANYQGSGPQTVVVAMYARPTGTFVPPSGSTSPPAAQPTTPTAPVAQPAPSTPKPAPVAAVPTPTPTPAPTPAPVEEKTAQQEQKPIEGESNPSPQGAEAAVQTQAKPVSRIEMWTKGKAPYIGLAISLVAGGSALVLLAKHGFTLKKILLGGEQLILHHPIFDIALVSLLIVSIYLTQTAGFVL